MINIREVARIAGVSPSTVSRVINGTAKVSPEKTAKVLQAISNTDYVPNEVARSLYRKSAKLIGLIVPSIKNPYFTQVANVIEHMAWENGYRVFLCDVGDNMEKEQLAIQTLTSMNADGIIIASTNEAIKDYLAMCQAAFNGLIAIGMTCVILSVGSVFALAAIICAKLLTSGVAAPLVILAALVIGTLLGLVSGILVAKCRLRAFIAALITMTAYRGLAMIITDGKLSLVWLLPLRATAVHSSSRLWARATC